MPVLQGAGPGSGPGLAWHCELNLDQLLAAIGATQPGPAGDEAAAAQEAAAAADAPEREITGAVADQLPAGPGLAAWISGVDPAATGEWDLPAVASAYRRIAAWAQAGELAAVAQLASHSAARDDHAHVDADGRPDQVTPAAGTTVGLELVMAHQAAMAWASLGVTLRWRLPATWAALRAGKIDVYRARLIAEAVAPLDDETARAVESAVLRRAGEQTSGQLRASLRRAVLAADPEGAEQRRQQAQRHAKVSLYPDPDADTATLAGTRLPSVHAAAAMARLTAIARAMKSAGQAGGLDYLRATAFIGLLLGTLPLVPPPDGDPGPAAPTDPDPGPPSSDPDPGEPDPGEPGPGEPGPGEPGPGKPGPSSSDRPAAGPRPGSPASPEPEDPGRPGPSGPGGDDGDPQDHAHPHPDKPAPPDSAPPDSAPPDPAPPDPAPPDPGPADDLRGQSDEDAEDEDDGPFTPGPPASWPPLPATAAQIPPFLGRPPPSHPPPDIPPPGSPAPPSHPPPQTHPPPARHPRSRARPRRPPPGLLELEISWRALTADPAGPATLSRIGPITAGPARLLARTAAADPHARWQVVVTDQNGYAIAVQTVRRHGIRATRPAGVTGLVTVTIPASALTQQADPRPDGSASGSATGGSATGSSVVDGIRAAVLRAARRAHTRAQRQAAADAAAPGGCAHTIATAAYRPTQKIRDYVTARDQTCRNPRCRQPARHGDLDHTKPFHKGGRTCSCNLGGYCRRDHQIKQLPGWTLTQTAPGHFKLTTPAGRSYTTTPDPYPA